MLGDDLENMAKTFASHAERKGVTLTEKDCVAIYANLATFARAARNIESQIVPMHARLTEVQEYSGNVLTFLKGNKK
ncbi:MAG: hypothetical protein R3E60_06945 [Alphaproteobacteria bacterium]